MSHSEFMFFDRLKMFSCKTEISNQCAFWVVKYAGSFLRNQSRILEFFLELIWQDET